MRWLVALLLLAGCGSGAAEGTDYHVDYAGGRDSADGTTPATAWKHAPGDANATDGPASVRLQPGDRVIFRPDVPYRGTIVMRASGAEGAPITYSGLGWGKDKETGMGIIDGSEPVTSAAPCPSAEACGGAADWRELTRILFEPPATSRVVLFGRQGLYWLSQLPLLDDPLFSDDRRQFAVLPPAQLDGLRRGELRNAGLAEAARGGGVLELAFWVRGNEVIRRPVLGVEGDVLRFDPEGLNFWEDRDGAVALNGSFAGVAAPGNYMVLAPGVILARLRPGDSAATLSVGTGRAGIALAKQSHIRIEGLWFRNLAGARGRLREGIGVGAFQNGSRDIEVAGNRFGPAAIESGQGIVQIFGTEDFRLIANRIEDVAFGSGLRTASVNRRLTVEGNVVRRIGRTAITMFAVDGAVVRGNMLLDIRGIHGNGITAYLANRDILIEGNCVVGSSRPLTFHGNKTPEVVNGITIRGNILVSQPGGQAAINSWGASTNGVVIEGNILAAPRTGLLMNQSDSNVRVTGNDTTGITTRGPARPDWVIADNSERLRFEDALAGRFSEDSCEVPLSRLKLKVVRAPG